VGGRGGKGVSDGEEWRAREAKEEFFEEEVCGGGREARRKRAAVSARWRACSVDAVGPCGAGRVLSYARLDLR
jgi:hypothetical protein